MVNLCRTSKQIKQLDFLAVLSGPASFAICWMTSLALGDRPLNWIVLL